MIPLIYHSIYSELPLPQGHRYPIHKYRLLFNEIEKVRFRDEQWRTFFHYCKPQALTPDEVIKTHCKQYVSELFSGHLPAARMRRIGFPWSECLIERTLTSAGGTCLTAEKAIEYGVAIHLSGGYHHAHYDFGSGFCLLNDLVLAAKRALTYESIDKVLIVDSDVHHGDGTATLCADHDDIVTLSFHCDKNFPARKPDSDMDVALPRETCDEEFLSSFVSVVEMAINLHQPDLILYDAGVDIHQDDELGYFNVSTQAIYQRDVAMFELAKTNSLPIGCVVGGGYRTDHSELVPIHMQLLNAAFQVYGNQ
ncbi:MULTISPECIES: histone deacetylase family protein [Vibrio]|uniref:Histone deacetylase n=1 Tax=Vibrio neptunius TaxID=170651 RepID=A0ABS3A7P6_9VIBR|nr:MULTISPECIES: histone deacetylase [Vibrio]MBN3494337.1 histone deacetylase [Vibrio neptunius]MBN3516741.1 histone deacetylase [Vibrio neptunius]MBN3551009.1 histone deacetylase [Vibrio neptunius]MBN3579074.1 histone deacetylase [Vibrio neptunius]MCH9872738.1 histone deacetylase [Vibrio neptunius]